jgi:hypothetical protein
VAITGEGRGAAVADFDGDGRVDLAVAQQGGRTVLLRNATARPGWPVRLEMPGPNASAVGAVVRGEFAGRPGPALEVRAGNGWWSQDSPRLILTGPSRPDAVIVRWPDGPESRHAWPVGAGEFRPRHP